MRIIKIAANLEQHNIKDLAFDGVGFNQLMKPVANSNSKRKVAARNLGINESDLGEFYSGFDHLIFNGKRSEVDFEWKQIEEADLEEIKTFLDSDYFMGEIGEGPEGPITKSQIENFELALSEKPSLGDILTALNEKGLTLVK